MPESMKSKEKILSDLNRDTVYAYALAYRGIATNIRQRFVFWIVIQQYKGELAFDILSPRTRLEYQEPDLVQGWI